MNVMTSTITIPNILGITIVEVDGPYRIDEYDGNESVMTPDSYDWITP